MYILIFFFFNDTATTEIYTLSLHDALPICLNLTLLYIDQLKFDSAAATIDGFQRCIAQYPLRNGEEHSALVSLARGRIEDRKSTRLNSSHANISYAVFCLKKKK